MMKNKTIYLFFAFVLSFLKPTFSYAYYSEPQIEAYASNFNCEERDAFRYISLGVGPVIFIPNIGVGYRERNAQYGWDAALSFSTIGYVHQISSHVVGHYYLSPFHKNSAYLGLGLMGSGVFTNDKDGGVTLSPNLVFGKELEKSGDRRHFIEMHVGIPTLWMESSHVDAMYFPLMYIKYGIAF